MVAGWSLVEGAFPSSPAGEVPAASGGWPCACADFGTGAGYTQLHLGAWVLSVLSLSPLKVTIM